VVGLNARESAAAAQRYVGTLRLSFPLVLDADGRINTLYGVVGLPTTFLIGRDGRAVALAVGIRDWEGAQARALLDALLAEPAPAAGR
jgi:peroxiredoxin